MCIEDLRLNRAKRFSNGSTNAVIGSATAFLSRRAGRTFVHVQTDGDGLQIYMKAQKPGGADVSLWRSSPYVLSYAFRIEDYGDMITNEFFCTSGIAVNTVWFTEIYLDEQ